MELFFFVMIPLSYYLNENVVFLAKDLIGKTLCSNIEGQLVKSIIVETEAYEGVTDKASHAYNNRFTERTKVMYQQGGIAYIYLCYGIHYLFNVVSHKKGTPHAVLIRGCIPYLGFETVKKRRNSSTLNFDTCIGPAKLSQAHGFTLQHNKQPLISETIYLDFNNFFEKELEILASPRIGIDYAEEDALLKYRFHLHEKNLKSIFNKVYKYV